MIVQRANRSEGNGVGASGGAADGRPAHSPSANRPGSEDGEPAATPLGFWVRLGHLDFWHELANLYPGPWEWLLPEAQASKGRLFPLRGTLDIGAELEPATLPRNCDQIKRRDCLKDYAAINLPEAPTLLFSADSPDPA